MNLSDLATTILRLENEPISKVRFAKTIYFVHKELIRIGKADSGEIQYIRMPLGPVPFGFMTLEQSNPAIIIKRVFTGLAYNTSQYTLQKKFFQRNQIKDYDVEIGTILGTLRLFSTSELVEFSHDDPSWKENVNGYLYSITEDDLKNRMPLRKKRPLSDAGADEQHLQASLVQGMIEDIVNESTDLEHPTHDPGKTGNL